MFWNWYTIDACFISPKWRITSIAMLVGSCIGVIGLVVLLELLRRLQREYDTFITRQAQKSKCKSECEESMSISEQPPHSALPLLYDWTHSLPLPLTDSGYLPTAAQQAVRAAMYTLQFAVAYSIMLLAMYYNGYILSSILVGAFVGSFLFSWEGIGSTAR